jgi:hypothetical protein
MRNIKSIRCGQGLGDSLYLQSVCRYFVKVKKQRLKVATSWPDIFRPLGDMVSIIPFTRQGIDIVAHYSMRKGIKETTQFQDCCLQAGIHDPVEMKLDWVPTNRKLISELKKHGKPIVLLQLPRNPMGRTDGFGKELMPDCNVIQSVIDSINHRALIVQVGAGQPIFEFEGVDIDLSNKTSVTDLLDIASVADGFLGYCSFMVPLAESFGKPGLFVWSSRGLRSIEPFIARITPRKILHCKTSSYVMDNWTQEQITEVTNGFLL